MKPKLRGYFHQEAFFVALGAGILLIAKSSTSAALISSTVYTLSLLLLFGISAIYHRPQWQPQHRAFMRRLDHSAIFIVIAGTFTPICQLALSEEAGHKLLAVVWIGATAGIIQSVFWVNAPKWLAAILYIVLGWLAVPYLSELKASLGMLNVWLLVTGGVVYTAGALFYVFKKPNFFPGTFGYHELFHIFTIIGAAFHFIVVYQLVR